MGTWYRSVLRDLNGKPRVPFSSQAHILPRKRLSSGYIVCFSIIVSGDGKSSYCPEYYFFIY